MIVSPTLHQLRQDFNTKKLIFHSPHHFLLSSLQPTTGLLLPSLMGGLLLNRVNIKEIRLLIIVAGKEFIQQAGILL